MAKSTRETVIEKLAAEYDGFRRGGFAKAICALEIIQMKAERVERNDPEDELDEDGEPIKIDFSLTEETRDAASIVSPSGYVIDWKAQMIIAFEYKADSKIADDKIGDYFRVYYDAVDPLGWGLALMVVNRWGARTAVDYLRVAHPGVDGYDEDSPMAGVKEAFDDEYRYALEMAKPKEDRRSSRAEALVKPARLGTKPEIWMKESVPEEFENLVDWRRRRDSLRREYDPTYVSARPTVPRDRA